MSSPVLSRGLFPVTLPVSWLYGAVAETRNWLYASGRRRMRRLPAPVISVGNITMGGSGKTPMVGYIAGHFLARSWPVCVLSRGYGRSRGRPVQVVATGARLSAGVGESGDEPMELASSVAGLAVAVGPNRFQAGAEVLARLGEHLFVLDDGFQHRELVRDLDLVCIDAETGAGELRLLPAGRLRESLANLNRASAIIWTRWRESRPSEAAASKILRRLNRPIPIFRSVSSISGFHPLTPSESVLPEDGLAGAEVGVVAGVARPERLHRDLEGRGAKVVWSCTRSDHYRWRPGEVESLLRRARAKGARAVVTTGKDAVKIGVMEGPIPLYRALLETRVLEAEEFEALLSSVPRPTGSG